MMTERRIKVDFPNIDLTPDDISGYYLDAGADIIKLAFESGDIFQMTIPTLTRDEALAAVGAAHQHGTIASAHVLLSGDLARAVEAGVDDIAHMVVVAEEAMQPAAKS